MAHQQADAAFFDFQGPPALLLGDAAQQELGEVGDVFQAVAQRRHVDGHDVEAVVQVFAEVAPLDGFLQVAVGGGDDAHPHFQGLGAADPFKLTFLQHAQQLGLERGRDFADFVEEDRALVGEFKAPLALVQRAGERAFLVAEQLGFQQVVGQGGAVEFDERPAGAGGVVVDGVGDDFLAGA